MKIKNVLTMTSMLLLMGLLFSFIAWHLGHTGFIINGRIRLPEPVSYISSVSLLFINFTLLLGFVLNIYTWTILKWSIPFTISIYIMSFITDPHLASGPIATGVIFIFLIVLKLNKWGYIRLLGITLGTIGINLLLSMIMDIGLLYGEANIYDMVRISLTVIIAMILVYSIGGVMYHERNRKNNQNQLDGVSKGCLELLVFPGEGRHQEVSYDSDQLHTQTAQDGPVDKFEVWIMRSVIGLVQIGQWLFILWVCSRDNLFVDALAITTSFICHGMIISKRRHLSPIVLCMLAATGMFYFAARFTISFQYSPFFPIVIGLILVYTLYRVDHQFEMAKIKKAVRNQERLTELSRRMDEAWNRLEEIAK